MNRHFRPGLRSWAVIASLLMAGLFVSPAYAHYVAEVSGEIQAWAPQEGYVVVAGVRYELTAETILLTEGGQRLQASQLAVGSQVRLLKEDSVAVELILLEGGSE